MRSHLNHPSPCYRVGFCADDKLSARIVELRADKKPSARNSTILFENLP